MNEHEYASHLRDRKRDSKVCMKQCHKIMNDPPKFTSSEIVGAVAPKLAVQKKNVKLQ